MHRIMSLFAALALLLSPAAMAEQAQPAPATAQQASQPALWKVADADTTIYLFGTVHALPPDVPWYRGKIAIAFEGSRELVTEITEVDPARMQSIVLSSAMLPKGQTLRGMMPAEQKVAFEAALAKLGLPPQSLDAFEPWYAAMALATLPLMRDGYATEMGVEKMLDARAKALGISHSGLETPEFQISLFDSLPPEAQKHYLAEVVEKLPTMKDELVQIIHAWKTGDAERLATLMNADEEDPAIVEALITNRNKNWAGWIKARLDKPGSVFIAVGAGHLAGPGSVQEQLAARGVTTTRVQ